MRLPTVRDNNAEELRAFDAVCEALAGFDDRISFESVDGFLTALAAGPQLPPAQAWLGALCADAFDRAFGDPEAHGKALRALQTRLKVLREQLDPEALFDNHDALRLNPLMSEWAEADRAALVAQGQASEDEAARLQTGALWAIGFLEGIDAFPEIWADPDEEEDAAYFGELYAQVEALAMPADDPELELHLAKNYPNGRVTRDELVTQAIFAVQDLRLFWVDHAPMPATRRVDKQPGRNDPCPCGSGKKFKKCHGSAAA